MRVLPQRSALRALQKRRSRTTSCQPVAARHIDEGSLVSVGSALGRGASLASWASAPARSTTPRCFLPRTSFLRPPRYGGKRITASELSPRIPGFDIVLGLDGAEVRVLRVLRHPAVERDLVHLAVESNPYPFQLTHNHRLLVEGPNGDLVAVTAGELLAHGRCSRIYDGRRFKNVVATREREVTEVVEVTFMDDACVLAWVLPRRAARACRPQLRDGAAVACLGARLRVEDNLRWDVQVSNTFLHSSKAVWPSRRVRSADARLQGSALPRE